ncbi:hypothetical protein GQX74_015142 [Glossina fuscipes]|nr:hypothetical protein GQX74_015142 [Glossina fuscipes]
MKQNQRVPCLNIEIAEHFCSDCDIRSNVNSEIRDTYARSNFYYLSILCCLKRKTISSYLRYSFHILLIICLITSAFGCGPGRSFGFSHRRNLNYRPKPLVQKEHVPNIPEQTLGASGVSEGAIKRDSPNFKKLIWVESDYIVFKDEEGTGADRFMSRINAGEEGLLVKKDKLKAYAKRFLKLNFVSKMGALDWLTNKSNIAPEGHIKRLRTTDFTG